MTYYEELGLPLSASEEQIRQAYKSLARLLHPDQQGEESLRRLAEAQMKRLNAIYAVLSDPVQRRFYDLSLEPGAGAPLVPTMPAPLVSGWRKLLRATHSDVRFAAWLVGATLLAGGLYWIFTGDARSRVPAAAPAWAPQAAAPAAEAAAEPLPESRDALLKELDHLRRRVQALEAERDDTRAHAAGPRARGLPAAGPASLAVPAPGGQTGAPLPEPPAISGQTPPTQAATAPQLAGPGMPPAPQAARPRLGISSFAGTWFYTPPRVAPSSKVLYPPEYIEAAIVEEAGVLRGRYYGRYRVSDRAISPEVIFQFEGRPQPEVAVLEWHGGGGAHGEIRLKLLSENAMEVNWSAAELGSPPGLAAGTAVLVRRVE
jgi:curved DNA-binding protein CbpA